MSEDNMYEEDLTDFLMHHGRDGQKWGIQNGPPYPLDRSKVSASGRAQYNWKKPKKRKSESLSRKSKSKIANKLSEFYEARAQVLSAKNKYLEQKALTKFYKKFPEYVVVSNGKRINNEESSNDSKKQRSYGKKHVLDNVARIAKDVATVGSSFVDVMTIGDRIDEEDYVAKKAKESAREAREKANEAAYRAATARNRYRSSTRSSLSP